VPPSPARHRGALRWPLSLTLALLTWTATRDAGAQPIRDGVRIDQLQPAGPESPFFRAEGPLYPGDRGVHVAAGFTFDYGSAVLKQVGVDTSGARTELATLVEHALLVRLGASLRPVPWLTFDVGLPISLFQSGEPGVYYGGQRPPEVSSGGIGDPRIGLHVRPLGGVDAALIAGARFWAPAGMESTYLSDRRFRAEVDVGVAGELRLWLYGATFSVAPGFFAARDGDRIAGSGAFYGKFGQMFAVGVEPGFAIVRQVAPNDAESLGVLFEPLVGARMSHRFLRVGLAAGPGLGGGQGSASFRGLLTVGFVLLGAPPPVSPSAGDRDLDGVPDERDACPSEAGPKSADPRRSGCPLRDRDGDGIADEVDACPDRPGVAHASARGNGCPDSDNDSVPDPIDACPREPAATVANGCPKYARLAGASFAIKPPIGFGRDDQLNATSREALEEIARTLRANPSLEQISISIGTRGAPPAVADQQAQQVLLVLRGAGLDPSRSVVVLRDDLPSGVVSVRVGQ
jgi:hypothetical protein